MLLFPNFFLISWYLMAQVSRDLFELNSVWNVEASMHILMIKFSLSMGGYSTGWFHLRVGGNGAWSVCTSYHQREEERAKIVWVWAKGFTTTDVPSDSPFLLSAMLWRIFSGGSPSSCEARDFSSYKLLRVTGLGKHAAIPQRNKALKK